MEMFNSDGTLREPSSGNKAKSGKGKFVSILTGIIVLIILITGFSSIVVTKENEYKLIRRFGRVERSVEKAGLSYKVPFVESVDTIPKEILFYDLPESDVITSDKKSMIVDSYVLWRVTDPLKFAQTLSYSVVNAESRIDTIVYNATKNTISNMSQDEVIRSRDGKIKVTENLAQVSANDVQADEAQLEEAKTEVEIKSLRSEIMDNMGEVGEQYGIAIMTVEVKKLDLPDANKEAVYNRMISERENIAAQYIAEGASAAQIIQNTTDRDVSVMQSKAKADAEELIAQGEAEYMKILSSAYADENRSQFYAFVRSLDAAKASLKGKDKNTLILPADSPIAKIFMGK